jgi:transcription initiation factor TFIID TATA-box-binding protein
MALSVYFNELEIAMIVMTFNINVTLDLQKLCRNNINCHYDQRRFAAAILRLKSDHCKPTALIFETGKVVLSGTKSPQDCDFYIANILQIIRVFYPNALMIEKKIVNITATSGINKKLILNEIEKNTVNSSNPWNTLYCAESFPGLNHRIDTVGTNVKIITFSSGKFNIVGSKSIQELELAFEYAKKWISDYLNNMEIN